MMSNTEMQGANQMFTTEAQNGIYLMCYIISQRKVNVHTNIQIQFICIIWISNVNFVALES